MNEIEKLGDRLEELPIGNIVRGIACFIIFGSGAFALREQGVFWFMMGLAVFFLAISFIGDDDDDSAPRP